MRRDFIYFEGVHFEKIYWRAWRRLRSGEQIFDQLAADRQWQQIMETICDLKKNNNVSSHIKLTIFDHKKTNNV